jgi:hypothetical protein
MLISKKARTGPPIGRQISTERCKSESVGLSILSILRTGSDQQDAASVPSIPANVFREIDSNGGNKGGTAASELRGFTRLGAFCRTAECTSSWCGASS